MRLYQKFICAILAFALCISNLAAIAAGGSFTYDKGRIIATLPSGNPVKATVELKNEEYPTLSYTFDLSKSSQLGLPVRQISLATYEVTVKFYDNSGHLLEETASQSIEIGSESPVGEIDTEIPSTTNNPYSSRAVMAPYADVYPSPSCIGEPIVRLKRLDLVSIVPPYGGTGDIYQVKGFIQSGEGQVENVDNVNAKYVDGLGLEFGVDSPAYIKKSAFVVDTYKRGPQYMSQDEIENMQREVVELAYSRQGIRGIYSQALRYQGYYLDCAALATWCWLQVGIDMSNGGTGSTACTGLSQWADNHPDTIVWKAEQSHEEAQAQVAAYKEALSSVCSCEIAKGGCTSDLCGGTCWNYEVVGEDWEWSEPDENGDREKEWYDVYDWVNHCICGGAESCSCQISPEELNFGACKYDTFLGEDSAIVFSTHVDETVYAKLQPGDIVFFNWEDTKSPENQYESHDYNEFISEENSGLAQFTYRWAESIGHGWDHVGVFVGLQDSRTALIIESSSPSTDPNKNTKITQVPLGQYKAQSIGKIIRPCGGVPQIEPEE